MFSKAIFSFLVLILLPVSPLVAFAPRVVKSWSSVLHSSRSWSIPETADNARLFQDFRTASGEILNPYKVLEIPRSADLTEIKQAYYKLSVKYHPDSYKTDQGILPRYCDSVEQVRDHWERIRLAYHVLRNPTLRKRFDRHEVLADPTAAMQRAAQDVALTAVVGFGKGIYKFGTFVLSQLASEDSGSVDTEASTTSDFQI